MKELYKDFDDLKRDIEKCNFCEKKFGFTPHPVVWGNSSAKIVQISQAPSSAVHESRKPFTDMSGKTLKYEWYNLSDDEFYNKDNFYIASMAHCYPGKNKNGNDKNPPKCCFDKWILKELEMIDNKLYIIIGAKAASSFFPNEKFEELVFKDNIWNGKIALVLPHPSPLNRRWIKAHPEFLNKRIYEIRKIIRKVLEEND